MTGVIIYSTKYGSTTKIVQLLASNISHKTDIIKLDKNAGIDLSKYDFVIIGSPVYKFRILKDIAKFCKDNNNLLLSKKLFLFTCGIAEDTEAEKYLLKAYPEELYKHVIAKEYLGGALCLDIITPTERFLIKNFIGIKEDRIIDKKDNINTFAGKINNLK